MARSGVIGRSVALGIKFYSNGVLVDPYDIQTVKIYDAETGGNIVATATATRLSVGYYQIEWSIPSSYTAGTYYDEWSWIAEEGMTTKVQRYSFTIVPISVSVAPPSVVRADVGCRARPTWEHLIGLRVVQDVGNGTGLLLSWGRALPNNTDNLVHYNIYYSSTRFGVFDSWPQAMTTNQQAVINVNPGKLYYFAVRATEFDADEFDITELDQIGVGLYQYPETLTLQEDIDAYGATVRVGDTSGYPDSGFLLIDTEVMMYSAKTATAFAVEDIERGAISTMISEHEAGAEVKLWRGVEDGNTVIFEETAAWHQSNGIPQDDDAIGQYGADSDGYRAVSSDILTTDLSASDENTIDFPGYDFCGYHRPSLQESFSGACTNSYLGGQFNGSRGFSLQDRNLARLDTMLQVTGEPLVLLRRKWEGRRCRCMGLRREHPRTRCAYCFSVGFDGGYNRYINPRPISETSVNTQGYIMARIYPYTDDLELDSAQSLRQPSELTAWTINVPTLKDRDFLVRFNEDGTEEFRYEVLDVTRNKLFFGQSGKQEFRMRRHDKTDVIYQFDISI